MDELRLRKTGRTALSVEQKAAFVFLMILGMGGLILGMLSFGANIRRPFDIQIASYTGEMVLGSEERERQEIQALKNRDSDGDGLSDYDELYIFKTSPYLADTDSDGIDDYAEIFAGEDPNCPRGQTCGAFFYGEETGSGTPLEPGFSLVPSSAASLGGPVGGGLNAPADILEYFAGLSTQEIRDLLAQQGVPAETLNQLSDRSLRELIEKSLSQAMAESGFDELLEAQDGQY